MKEALKGLRKNKAYESLLILGFLFAFMITIFEPLCIFFENKKEYVYDVYSLIPVCLMLFLCIFAVELAAFTVFSIMNDKLSYFVLLSFFAVTICLYVQGNFFVGKLPIMDGREVVWNEYYPQYVQSALIWGGIIAVVFIAAHILKKDKMLKIVRIVSFVLLAIFSVTVVTTGIVTKGYEKNLDIYLTSNNVMDYSNDKNFIIIVMDMARGEYEKAALDNNQEFRESFKDFTYYDNYASGYFFTDFALPLIISGEWFEGQERYDDYNKHAFYKSDFIGQMKKNGYKLGLYTDNANTNTEDSLIYQNAVNTVPKLAHPVIFSKVWLKMVAYKYFPFFLKKYVQVYPNEFNQYFEYDNNYRKWNFAESNIFFYRECKNLKYNVDRDPQFKLIHLKGVHVPFDMIDPETDEWVPTLSYDDSIKSMDIMMEAYLNRLKEDGVYDNSVIIFMSDHGVSFDGMHEMWERQDSFLMIKGFDEHHDILQINSAPISQADLKDSYYELLNGKGGGEIFKWNEGDERERRIIYTDYDYVMKECIIKGDSKDTNYIFTGNEYGEAIIGKFHR